jgi:cellulose biosynthesis protein BcsQ
MDKIQLLLLDDDQLYADNVMSFVRATEFADKVQVKLFTKIELMMQLLEKEAAASIVIISDAFLPKWRSIPSSVMVLHVSNTLSTHIESEDGLPSLYRFQPLHQLLTRILAYYTERNLGGVVPSKKTTQVVSLFSSVGSSGKTSAAIHLAKQLSFRGKRVFYLNLESLSSVNQLLQGGEQQNFSQILYYLRSSPALLGPKLELLKSYDPRSGIDYLTPCNHIRELQEMSGEDIRILVEALVSLKSYDYILLDLEASVHFRIMKSIEVSDLVLWMIMDDLNCLHKTVALRKAIASQTSIHFILNKFTGSLYNDFDSAGILIKGYLPYIPEWKTVHAPEQVWSSSIFSEQIYELFESLISRREEVPA